MNIAFPLKLRSGQISEYDVSNSPAPSKMKKIGLINEWQSVFQVGRIGLNYHSLVKSKQGNGERVMLLPGFLATDSAMYPLKHYLNRIGYTAEDWKLGLNTGNVEKYRNRLLQKLEAENSDEKVTLVGWSLGGVIAREVARMMPKKVDSVFTLGSPIKGPEYTVAAEIYGKKKNRDIAAQLADLDQTTPIQVPISILFSKNDKVVSWPSCLDTSNEQVKHYEITSTHLSMLIDPRVWQLLAVHLKENLDR